MRPGLGQHILRKDWTRHPFVLMDGQPLSGTTRTMYEAVSDIGPDAQVIVMEPADLVAAAFSGGFDDLSPYDDHVVWLDDLTPGALVLLDREALDIITVHATVLANTTTRWRDLLATDTTALTAETRSILDDIATSITVPFAIDNAERQRVQLAVPGVHIGTSVAASLVGADELLRRYDYALRVFPAARKLAEVAVDIRRAGVHRGMTKRELYNVYSQATTLGLAACQEFEQAFQWVTEIPVGASMGVLMSVGEDRWSAATYLAGADDGDHGHPVRLLNESRVSVLLAELPADDAFDVAVAALLRGHRDVARKGFKRAERHCGDAVVRVRALRAAEQLSY